jgi:hypothetical protein
MSFVIVQMSFVIVQMSYRFVQMSFVMVQMSYRFVQTGNCRQPPDASVKGQTCNPYPAYIYLFLI